MFNHMKQFFDVQLPSLSNKYKKCLFIVKNTLYYYYTQNNVYPHR